METIEFKVQEFKNMTLNPDDAVADVNEKGRRICQVEIHEIPRVLREYILFPDSDETVWDKTLSIMKQHPQQLWLMSKPITIHASKVLFDNRKHKVFLSFREKEMNGVCAGANILRAILDNRDDSNVNREMYIELELLSGLSSDEVKKVAEFRSF